MLTFKQFLEESRSAPLYHATHAFAAMEIAEENKILAMTDHMMNRVSGSRGANKARSGISLTRSFAFAKKWGDMKSRGGYAIFQLDQRKLAQRHKMIPYNHFQDRLYTGNEKPMTRQKNDVTAMGFPINQYEEFLIGNIENLDRYVTAVFTSTLFKDEYIDRLKDIFHQAEFKEL